MEDQSKFVSEAEYLDLAGKFNRQVLREAVLRLRVEKLEEDLKAERRWGKQALASLAVGIAALFLLIIFSVVT
jgi:hypothetical protein